MRMLDYTAAFPKKVPLEQYMPIIEAALKAAKGADNMPKVVVEDYENSKLATRAANAIRNHSRAKDLALRVSYPDSNNPKNSIYVWKGKPYVRKAKPDALPPADKPAADPKPD